MCDGHEDCLNGEDEEGCTTEGCLNMGKYKCPDEDKCIEKKFLCDDDGDGSYWEAKYGRNKCEFNEDESNHACQCRRLLQGKDEPNNTCQCRLQQGKFVCPSKAGGVHLNGFAYLTIFVTFVQTFT